MIQLVLIILNFIAFPAKDYFNAVYKAEDCITHYKYDEAISHYEAAFAINDSPFLKDIHNALICSIKCNSTSKAKMFCSYFAKFNINPDYLKNPFFKDSLTSDIVLGYLIEAINGSQTKPTKLNSILDSIYMVDQAIREKCKEITTDYYSVCKDTILYIDSVNLIALTSAFKKFGFPRENVIRNYIPGTMPNILWVICHNKTKISQIITPILEDAVMNLSLHPQLLSFILGGNMESYQYQDFGLGYSIQLNEQLYVFDVTDLAIKKRINLNRQNYMLDDIDSYNNRIKFQYFHPEFKLVYPLMISTFLADTATTEMLEQRWKGSKVTEYKIK